MARLTPLSKWMIAQPGKVVAVRSGEPISVPVFVTRVQVWIDSLCDHPGKRWAVYHSDSAEFLAILLALWQLGRTACIPSDNRPGTVTRMASSVDGFIGDFPSAPGATDHPVSSKSHPWKWITPEHNLLALEIYTSGSTGDPKSISKTIAQLEREIEVLESLWPNDPDSVVLTTVSHQHLYGMTFALFWPFSSLRAFETKLCEFPEDIIHKAGLYPHFSLVSSPSHLGRFNASLDWSGNASRCKFVISSAAPLLREDSIAVGLLLNTQVREIYGSSETGAIAWRSQQDSETGALWKALPQVELESSEGAGLTVRSPYLGELDHFVLPDKVQFNHQGCFKLIGRMDRIVKVEGKRVSLALIEGLLHDHEWVKEVSALTIERSRIETAIVMQLNQEGVIHLQNSGRKALIKTFKNLLSDHLESVVLPRRWRFVECMPFNRQGKLPLDRLQALFEKEDLKWPQIIDRQIDGERVVIQCYIPPRLIYFSGHMPNQPILPGIVQIHWAEAYGRRWLAVAGQFDRLEVIKFQQVILPEYKVEISLKFDKVTRKLSFRYESERGVHSSGRICFRG